MPKIVVNSDEKSLHTDLETGMVSVNISSKENNGLSISSGILIYIVDSDTVSPGGIYYPGNSVSGVNNKELPIIRCSSSVSRRVNADTTHGDITTDGVNMQKLIKTVLGR